MFNLLNRPLDQDDLYQLDFLQEVDTVECVGWCDHAPAVLLPAFEGEGDTYPGESDIESTETGGEG